MGVTITDDLRPRTQCLLSAAKARKVTGMVNYLVNYLVWPHQQDAHRRGLGLSGSIHKEAHPIVSNFS